jgi:hypothetical protein
VHYALFYRLRAPSFEDSVAKYAVNKRDGTKIKVKTFRATKSSRESVMKPNSFFSDPALDGDVI